MSGPETASHASRSPQPRRVIRMPEANGSASRAARGGANGGAAIARDGDRNGGHGGGGRVKVYGGKAAAVLGAPSPVDNRDGVGGAAAGRGVDASGAVPVPASGAAASGLEPSPPHFGRPRERPGKARQAARAAAERNAAAKARQAEVDIFTEGLPKASAASAAGAGGAAAPVRFVPGSELPRDVAAVVRDYGRGIRQVFTFYAGSGASSRPGTFAAKDKLQSITLAEVTTCAKAFDIYPSLVKRAELSAAYRTCLSVKVDPKGLVVGQFAALMARLSLAATSSAALRGTYESVAAGDRVRAVFARLGLHQPGKAMSERLKRMRREASQVGPSGSGGGAGARARTPPLRERLRAVEPVATSKST